MSTRRAEWPATDLDLVARLRVQLDELQNAVAIRDATIADLEAKVADRDVAVAALRQVLNDEAESIAAGDAPEKSTGYWIAAFANVNRMRNAAMVRLTKVEQWLREQGEESTRLQAERDLAREETDQLRRMLDASEKRVATLEAHVEQLGDTVASREVGR